MNEDRIKEIEEEIGLLRAQLERLEHELEKLRQARKHQASLRTEPVARDGISMPEPKTEKGETP